MKIGILLRILWPAGAQKIAINEAKELAKLGHDVMLYFLRSSSFGYKYEDLLDGVSYTVLSPNHRSMTSPIYSTITRMFAKDRGDESRVDFDLIRKFPHFIKDEKIDYLICHDQWAGLAGYYAFKKYGTPYSVFIHEKVSSYGFPILGKLVTRFEKQTLESSHRVFTVTDKVKSTVISKYPELKEKAVTNQPGIEIKEVKPYGRRESAIISVSMWDRGRHPELYLQIASQLPQYEFLLVGSWRIKELKDEIINKINYDGIKNVSIIEGIPENQLDELYSNSKFLLRFGFGEYGPAMAVIEAIAHGTPVIINRELGTADLISENSAGAVIENPIDAADAILKNDNELKYKQMQSGILKISEKYSWRNHVQKLLTGL